MLTFEYRVCPDVRAQGLGCDFFDPALGLLEAADLFCHELSRHFK
jgi:hypothetical protein